MFKKHALTVQVTKTPTPPSAPSEPRRPRMDPMMLNSLVKIQIRDAAVLVGAGFALHKVLTTASEIAILAAKSNFK